MGNRAEKLKNMSSFENKIKAVNKTAEVYFGIFCEGTGNHKDSAAEGAKKRKEGIDTSKWEPPYNVAKSNVTMLHDIYDIETGKYIDRIYIEGVGVSEDGTDTSTYGLVTGMGDYGIHKKVEKAINEIKTKIPKIKIPSNSKVNLHIDVFGFSRGTAVARFLIGALREKKMEINKCLSAGSTLNNITFDFAGLYDSVSSYGVPSGTKSGAVAGAAGVGSLGGPIGAAVGIIAASQLPSHKNNVKDLKLDSVQYAKKVFQICAADEFRENFALTNINSAGANGLEIFLPGCHTDIGGGYLSGRGETLQEGYLNDEDTVLLQNVEPTWTTRSNSYDIGYELGSFIRFGWARTTPGEEYTFSEKGELIFSNNMKRKKGYYPCLTYELMRNYACDNHQRKNVFGNIDFDYKTPAALEFIKKEALNCTSIYVCREKFMDKYRELTKNWLHFSSKHIKIKDDKVKGVLDPFAPRVVNKILKREIVNG